MKIKDLENMSDEALENLLETFETAVASLKNEKTRRYLAKNDKENSREK